MWLISEVWRYRQMPTLRLNPWGLWISKRREPRARSFSLLRSNGVKMTEKWPGSWMMRYGMYIRSCLSTWISKLEDEFILNVGGCNTQKFRLFLCFWVFIYQLYVHVYHDILCPINNNFCLILSIWLWSHISFSPDYSSWSVSQMFSHSRLFWGLKR